MQKERINVEEASLILGVPMRNVCKLANNGLLPSAAKIGKRWTFDIKELRVWVKDQEAIQCQKTHRKTPIGAGKHFGEGVRLRAKNIDLAYEQRMLALRRGDFRKSIKS